MTNLNEKPDAAAELNEEDLKSVSGGYSIKHPMTKEEYLKSIGSSGHAKPDPKGIPDDGVLADFMISQAQEAQSNDRLK